MESTTQIWRLTDAIQIQTEAVVSRTLVNQKCGTVTLFGFDRAQGLSEHTAPYDALVQVLEGTMDITVSGEVFHVNQGEMILMPANQPHALLAIEPARMMLTMIRS